MQKCTSSGIFIGKGWIDYLSLLSGFNIEAREQWIHWKFFISLFSNPCKIYINCTLQIIKQDMKNLDLWVWSDYLSCLKSYFPLNHALHIFLISQRNHLAARMDNFHCFEFLFPFYLESWVFILFCIWMIRFAFLAKQQNLLKWVVPRVPSF